MTAADYDAEHERTVRELRADGKPAAENPFRSACAWAAERPPKWTLDKYMQK